MNKKFLVPLILVILVAIVLGGGWLLLRNRVSWLGGESSSSTEEEEEESASESEDTVCPIGSHWRYGEVEYQITGYETHSLGGSNRRLCCSVWENASEGEKMKHCYDTSDEANYYISWVSNAETGGEYVRAMESYKQGEESCFKLYETDGSISMEGCQ